MNERKLFIVASPKCLLPILPCQLCNMAYCTSCQNKITYVVAAFHVHCALATVSFICGSIMSRKIICIFCTYGY